MDNHILIFLGDYMRSKILIAAVLILLGVAAYSAYSASNNGSVSDDNSSIIQKVEVNNSSCFVFSKELNSFETVIIHSNGLRKVTKNESAAECSSEVDKNDIFKEIILKNNSIEPPESCVDFKTVIVNPVKFRELASNGTLNLSLMGENYELNLHERETRKLNVSSYSGYIVDKPQSSAFFTVRNDSINGCVNVDFYTLSYGISSTEEEYNGKIIHIVSKYYNERAEEELKKRYSLDPLKFSLTNGDKETHEISVELLDFYNRSIFKQTYVANPGDEISSPKIEAELGIYRYEIILDKELSYEQTVRADYAAELGSSEKLFIYITNDPENPVTFGIEIA